MELSLSKQTSMPSGTEETTPIKSEIFLTIFKVGFPQDSTIPFGCLNESGDETFDGRTDIHDLYILHLQIALGAK
jgi:hypothetical protein